LQLRRPDLWLINFKVPNRPVAVDAWERSACYPRGSFYPISYVHTTMHRRITLTCFRTCSSRFSRSQAGLSQYRFSTISIRAKPTFVHLRCHLGGDLPSQTAHQTMSFCRVFMRQKSNACSIQREVFHDCPKAPSYSKQLDKTYKCQATVKLPGSFCPRTTRPRLHSHLNFAVYVFKTVAQSFYHSCGSELTRQGTSLYLCYS